MEHNAAPGLGEIARVFLRIGLRSFGGPAAQIALMNEEIVEKRGWLDKDDFLAALSFCSVLPGPEAMQLATFLGWRLQGQIGGLLAGVLFILPGSVLIACCALFYVHFQLSDIVNGVLLGAKAVVVALISFALVRMARSFLNGWFDWLIVAVAFVGLFLLALPFPAVIGVVALIGLCVHFNAEWKAPLPKRKSPWGWGRSLRSVLLWGVVWLIPLALAAMFHLDSVAEIGVFFGKLAFLSFGGAYAVLAYMAQDMVHAMGWLSERQMVDALGLAETTPGPLILVTQFTGHIAAVQTGGNFWLGGAIAIWMIFVPSFMWIFVFAPHLSAILSNRFVHAAFLGVRAAVIGVIAHVALWLLIEVLFLEAWQIASFQVPVLMSLDWRAASIALISALFLARGFDMLYVILSGAFAGAAMSYLHLI